MCLLRTLEYIRERPITHCDPLQVKLLQSLGLRSTPTTDGSQPVNLFTTAKGLLGAIGNGPVTKQYRGRRLGTYIIHMRRENV